MKHWGRSAKGRLEHGRPVSALEHSRMQWSRPISALERLIMKRNAETGTREACRSLRVQMSTLEQAADRLDRLIAEHVTEREAEPDIQPQAKPDTQP